MNDTIIKQFAKQVSKNTIHEFYEFVYTILNNLICTDIKDNLKLVFINYLMFEKTIIFFKDKEDNLQVGRLRRWITRDENNLPIDITVQTLNGTIYNLLENEYVIIYNPIPTNYLRVKVEEISNVENVIMYLRKLYKTPIIFQSKDSKVLRSVKEFIKRIFSTDEVCTITCDGFDASKHLNKVDLNIEYITDKLLDENESLKEDILEILGIYKNTSGNRERVNETELIISNSLTTVNKLGLEDCLRTKFKEIKDVLGFDYNIDLNVNKIFDIKGGVE